MSHVPPGPQHAAAPTKAQNVHDTQALRLLKLRLGFRVLCILDCLTLIALLASTWNTIRTNWRDVLFAPLIWACLCIVWDGIDLALTSRRTLQRWRSHVKIHTRWMGFSVGIEVFLLAICIPVFMFHSLLGMDNEVRLALAILLGLLRAFFLTVVCIDMSNRNRDVQISEVIKRIQQHRAANAMRRPDGEDTQKLTAGPSIPLPNPDINHPARAVTGHQRRDVGRPPHIDSEMNYEDTRKYVVDFLAAQRR